MFEYFLKFCSESKTFSGSYSVERGGCSVFTNILTKLLTRYQLTIKTTGGYCPTTDTANNLPPTKIYQD